MTRDRLGSAAETLFFVLLATVLVFGGVEVGRGFALRDALDTGVSTAARQLSLDPSAWNAAEATVRGEVDANFLGGGYGAQVVISLLDANGAPIAPGTLAAMGFGAEFRLRASLPITLSVPLCCSRPLTLAAEHRMLVERYP